jgi:formylglycine-generating enzyme required for sulfatase activity
VNSANVEELFAGYFDGTLSPKDEIRLAKFLLENSAAQARFEALSAVHGMLFARATAEETRLELLRRVSLSICGDESARRTTMEVMNRIRKCASPKIQRRTAAQTKRARNNRHTGWGWVFAVTAVAAAFMFIFHLFNLYMINNTQAALTAEIIALSGPVALANEPAPAKVGTLVIPDEGLKTGAGGRVKFRYPDGTTIDLKEESSLSLLKHERAKRLALKQGEIFAEVAKQKPDEALTIVTPHGEATVVGTQLKLAVAKESTRLEVTQGKVRLTNLDKKFVDVEAENYAVAAAGMELSAKPIAAAVPSETVSDPPKEFVLDLGGGVKMELVLVKAGEFNMGSNDGEENEKPVHKVKISQPYYIGKYDVTVAQFRAFADAAKFQTLAEKQNKGWTLKDGTWQEVSGVNWRNPGFKQEDNHPVVVVTWNEAQEFCLWATKATGRTVRLPTEAEWEYAARGPKSPKYPWGDKWEGVLANVADASLRRAGFNIKYGEIMEDDGYPFTSPGGAYKNASWCGAYDMAGNVWQWCQDFFNNKYYGESPAVDPQGAANGDDRVRRGGGWTSPPSDCRPARRVGHHPRGCSAVGGFRVVVGGVSFNRP